ncbi:MAG: hypothetical protein QOH31_4291, partial [Verrucomicrobiota bacterium]
MRPDTNHSKKHDTLTTAGSSQLVPSLLAPNRLPRRSFLRNLGLGAALLAPGAALLGNAGKALASNGNRRASAANGNRRQNNALSRGDVAILQLLAAAELIEADLWQQYNELGGVNAPASGYTAALQILDGDQPQYI